MNREKYETIIKSQLMPDALKMLRQFYTDYKNGCDLDVLDKKDGSPASFADRETEKYLRDKIEKFFPEDGIWGEEYGGNNLESDTIWVLDPLDGTKEFLSKKDHHFGCLIGVIHKGKSICGAIGDPLNDRIYDGKNSQDLELKDNITLSVTNPEIMFKTNKEISFWKAIKAQFPNLIEELNCMGFVRLLEGSIDLVIENDLKIHDIVPLIPLLSQSGIYVTDFYGNDYSQYKFNLKLAEKQTFSIIATPYKNVLSDVLSYFKESKEYE